MSTAIAPLARRRAPLARLVVAFAAAILVPLGALTAVSPAHATVTGAEPGDASVTKTSAAVTVTALSFTTTPTPTLQGTAVVGNTLAALRKTWAPTPDTFGYQWLRNGQPIAGATAMSYVLTDTDVGTQVSAAVTASKAGYTSVTMTTKPATVLRLTFTTVPTPTISGTPALGVTLAAKRGTWNAVPTTFAYQWLRDGQPIAGATAATYTTTEADAGRKIAVTITGSRVGYTTASKTSAAVTITAQTLTTTPKPKISGSATVGTTVAAKRGTWAPEPDAFGYQWLRDGQPIAGATKATYALAAADAGRTITVSVTGSKAGYLTVTTVSAGIVVAGG